MDRGVDVSQIVWLRQRFGRAQLALKFAGINASPVTGSAAYAAVQRFSPSEPTALIIGVLAALATIFGGFLLARGLRRGNHHAIQLVAMAWVAYAAASGWFLGEAIVAPQLTFGILISLLLWIGPMYLILRGLLAVQALTTAWPEGVMPELIRLVSPWESNEKVSRPAAFANKRSLGMYLMLVLVPLPWLLLQASQLSNATVPRTPSDPADLLGYQMGQFVFALFLYLPPTVAIYRAARRRSLRRATDFLNDPDRPPVLYLRSFGDDQLKMRARATDGRSWLEAALRVSVEEVVVDHLFRFGPVIAIGRPGQGATLGAAREYVADAAWQQRVDSLMDRAAVIVAVVGGSEGLLWEIQQIFERKLAPKLILLVPPIDEEDRRTRWEDVRGRMTRFISVPEHVDLWRTCALVAANGDELVAIEAEGRDAWSYEVALEAAVQLGRRDSADLTALPDRRLAGVPTSSTDRLGHLITGLCGGLIVGTTISLTATIGALVAFTVTRENPLATGVALAAFQAPVVWLILGHWLPGISRSERLVFRALPLIAVPIALASGPLAIAAMLPAGMLYGLYFAARWPLAGSYRLTRPRRRRRRLIPVALRRGVGRLIGALGRLLLITLVIEIICGGTASMTFSAAPRNMLVVGLATGTVQATLLWFIVARWLPSVSRRERLLLAGLAVSYIPVSLGLGVTASQLLALLWGLIFGVYFAIRWDRAESTRMWLAKTETGKAASRRDRSQSARCPGCR